MEKVNPIGDGKSDKEGDPEADKIKNDIMKSKTLLVTRAQIFLGNFKSLRLLEDGCNAHNILNWNFKWITF